MDSRDEERAPLLRRSSSNTPPANYFSLSSSTRTRLLSIILGQVLSVLLCLSAVTSVYLGSLYGVRVPTFQNFLFYCILAVVFSSAVACRSATGPSDGRGGGRGNLFHVLKTRGWRYFLVALCDAEANYLVVKAYQYTTLTSVQLLDCFTIPTVLLLSRFLLRIQYRALHFVGVVICLVGVSCLVWADIEEGIPSGQGNDRLLGDVLCLLGAFLYGVSNVTQEFLVKTFDMVEFLGMIGIFGALITGIQACMLEWDQVTEAILESSSASLWSILGLLAGFALIQFTFYILAARLMKLSSATVYNLSILSADFYSLLVGIFLFKYQFHALYFISFVLVLTGVMVFSVKPTSTAHSSAQTAQQQPGVINSIPEAETETENDD